MADARSVCSESRTPLVYLHAQLGRWARGGVRVNNGTGAMHVHRVAPARRDVRVGSGAVYVVPLFCGPITISRSILPLGRQLCKGTSRRSTCLICPASPPPPLLPLPRPHLLQASPSGLLHPPPLLPLQTINFTELLSCCSLGSVAADLRQERVTEAVAGTRSLR